MSNQVAYWKDASALDGELRHKRKKDNTDLLDSKNIKFNSFNNGFHLVLEDFPYEFWPSTETYRNTSTNKTKSGIADLLKELDL